MDGADDSFAAVEAQLREAAALAARDADAALDLLLPLLRDTGWIARRVDTALTPLRSDPLALAPLRPFQGRWFAGVVLAEVAPIRLALIVRPFTAGSTAAGAARSAVFSSGVSLTRFLRSGGARLDHFAVTLTEAERQGGFRAASAAPCRRDGHTMIADDSIIRCDHSTQCFSIMDSQGDVAMVQAFVEQAGAVPTRDYDATSGQLRHVAGAQRDDSFRQMGLTLLRAMGRRDAVAQFAAEAGRADFGLRWHALRELVALDCDAARPLLDHAATQDPHPEVRAAAVATLALIAARQSLKQPEPA